MKVKKYVALILFLLLLVGGTFVSLRYYSYIFARVVHGEVIGIDRVTEADMVIGGRNGVPPSQMYSFAIAIKDSNAKGEIVTASSEDRQWAVVEKGQCAEAKFFPYPPWQLEKSGTYYGARLLRLYECPK